MVSGIYVHMRTLLCRWITSVLSYGFSSSQILWKAVPTTRSAISCIINHLYLSLDPQKMPAPPKKILCFDHHNVPEQCIYAKTVQTGREIRNVVTDMHHYHLSD